MQYGYVRISSIGQNVERQLEQMYKFGLTDKQIYIDKQNGKDFDRANYKKLRKKIKKDDLLIIHSIDRLGRNYSMIIDEWHYLTKIAQADILVLDMPLLDTRIDTSLLSGNFISEIVLQILSFVAQNERETIRIRQAEGIRIAREKGVHLGRPKYVLPPNYAEFAQMYLDHKLSLNETCQKLDMKRTTFSKYLKIYVRNKEAHE